MNIYEKLMNVQSELKAPKGQYNNFGKYKYRSCEDILESLKPVLNKYKLAIMISDEVVEVNNRNYIKATITLINAEKADEQIQVNALAREEETKKGMDGSQITGASSSYARKYALNGMFAIDDTKDADALPPTEKEQPKKEYVADDLDNRFLEVWNSLTPEQQHKIGEAYPNKWGKPQLNPQYFKRNEKEEILKKLNK